VTKFAPELFLQFFSCLHLILFWKRRGMFYHAVARFPTQPPLTSCGGIPFYYSTGRSSGSW
jgi:hypothetical protein